MGTWLNFFKHHAPFYMQNVFVRNTIAEVDFIEQELHLKPGCRILDMGCGTGRHSIELTRRGYSVTGVDLSPDMLAQAKNASNEAHLDIEWINVDARNFTTDQPYDAAICLCEGGMGLIEFGEDPIEHDAAILRAISNALLPNAPFLLTALNGYRAIREATDEDVQAGRFDPAAAMAHKVESMDLPEGTMQVEYAERLFTPPEMVRLLRQEGFAIQYVWGGTAGSWNKQPIRLDEIEMMFVCRKCPDVA